MLKRLRIGIAGIGGQGRTHVCNSIRLKDIKVVAIADRSKHTLSKVSELGIKSYTDYREMIGKEKLDAVIIALPNYLHEESSTLAAETGCDILIEKPLARNTEEAKRIADKVRKEGVRLMVGMCQRFTTSCQRLKKEIDEGMLGRIDFASGLFFTGPFFEGGRVSKWMFDPLKIGGGALLDTGCHLVDLFIWFFGSNLHSVVGYTESSLNLGYDDYAEVSMRFKNGVNALIVVSWRTRIPCYRIEVVGEYGRRVALSKRFGIFDVGLRKGLTSFVKENIVQRIKGRPFLPLGEEYYKELAYFVKSILNDEKPKPDANDWLKVSEIIDLVYRQNLTEDTQVQAYGGDK